MYNTKIKRPRQQRNPLLTKGGTNKAPKYIHTQYKICEATWAQPKRATSQLIILHKPRQATGLILHTEMKAIETKCERTKDKTNRKGKKDR